MRSSIPLVLAMVGLATLAAAQTAGDHQKTSALPDIPSSLKVDHEKLHADLSALTALPGRTGEAAKQVAEVLHEHFVKEEEFALPPLALLAPIAEGHATPEMRPVIALTDQLRKDMPQMLREHQAIVEALHELGRAAEAERQPDASRFVEELTAHAQTEEQVLYPAAILVGEYLKLTFPGKRTP